MATTNGSTTVKVTNYNNLVFSWSLSSQNATAKSSTISWKMELTAGSSGAINSVAAKNYSIEIDGKKYTGTNSVGIGNNRTITLASGTTTITHNADGTKTFSYFFSQDFNITFSGTNIGTRSGAGSGSLEIIPVAATITSAPHFTDEENPTIYYSNPIGNNATSLQACISFDGSNDNIPYRDINKTGSYYTFNLTDNERNIIRNATTRGTTLKVYFYIRTIAQGQTFYSNVSKICSLENATPTLNPTYLDINEDIVDLTEDSSTIVRYASSIGYNFNAAARKGASIKSYKVVCGSQTATTASGTIHQPASNELVFTVTDSRGLTSTKTITISKFIEYIKPTISVPQMVLMPTGALVFTIKGDVFTSTATLLPQTWELRYKVYNSAGELQAQGNTIPNILEDNSYKNSVTINNLVESDSYYLWASMTDAINSVYITTEQISAIPVFDWSKTDFNFNVPVSINGRELGGYRILWEGDDKLDTANTRTLNEKISEQTNGIILIFSLVSTTGTAQDASWQSFYKSKHEIALTNEASGGLGHMPHTFLLGINSGFSVIGAKYIYIGDQTFYGNTTNGASGANSGITFNNARFTLRYILGV